MSALGPCRSLWLACALVAAIPPSTAPVAAALSRPETVSPGSTERVVTVANGAPTFSWSPYPGMSTELVVYPLPEETTPSAGELEPVLRRRLPAGASTFTPPLEEALPPGEYAWFVRVVEHGGDGPWSEARLFRVLAPTATGPDEVHGEGNDAGIASSRRDGRRASPAEAREAAAPGSGNAASRAARGVQPSAAMPQLRVAGIVDAVTFTGDGSMLSGIATDEELQAHVSDAAAHGTCDGQPCNGVLFTNVVAAAGDSATNFFDSGTIAAARIDSTIARDAEVAALLGGATLVRVSGGGTSAQNGAALEAAIAGIGDASAAKRYAVLLGPGVYDVGSDGVALAPFVHLQGTSAAATIVVGSGAPQFSSNVGTLILADDVLVERLTVRNVGGADTAAYGVRGWGARWRVQDTRIEVITNGASQSGGFCGASVADLVDHSGELVRVDIVVDQGDGIGGGSFGDLKSLHVHDSAITVLGKGTGIGDAHLASSQSVLLVTDTHIRVLGGGTGVSGTWPDLQLYRNVIVEVSGGSTGSNSGFSDFGSTFRPIIENSRIVMSGPNAAGIRTNNGVVTLSGSTIQAPNARGIDANVFGSFGGTFTISDSTIVAGTGVELTSQEGRHLVQVDHSTFVVHTAFRTTSSSDGGTPGVHRIRVGASRVDASFLVVQQQTPGSADAICVASYDGDYAALPAGC